ncbi:hypothetical protein FSARC_1663 [Fusarium sarcochroum]|uniref:DUF7730 domain-containing protein n=1 Tax=Fusarium sarcochroum TaxID=1208366 RepID=A0A8H4U845_9HYPO|nr:hypothetical protein FSARC_1663 [Fusarium sarcochroum]
MNVKFNTGLRQSESPLFAKVPSEIRRMIFLELFGNRQVHITLNQSKSNDVSFRREGRPLSGRKWAHCVCRRHPDSDVHSHSEEDHKWVFLSAGIAFTCKRAFEQGLKILYGTNTLIFDFTLEFDDLKKFWRWRPRMNNLNLNLEFVVGVDFLDDEGLGPDGPGMADRFTELCKILYRFTKKNKLSVRISISRYCEELPPSPEVKTAGLKDIKAGLEILARREHVTGKLSVSHCLVDELREMLATSAGISQRFEVLGRESEYEEFDIHGEDSDEFPYDDAYWFHRNYHYEGSDSEVTELGNEY